MSEDKDPQDEPDENTLEAGTRERGEHYPEEGYHLVEIDTFEPLGQSLRTVESTLTLSPIDLPEPNSFNDWVVYDSEGRAYAQQTLHDNDLGDSDNVTQYIETAQSATGRDQRIALVGLARAADTDPAACIPAIPVLRDRLDSDTPAVRAEALLALSRIANSHPAELAPAIEDVQPFLAPDQPGEVQLAAIDLVKAVADSDPDAVIDVVPALATLLDTDTPGTQGVLLALHRIAGAHPAAVVPVADDLKTAIEDGDDDETLLALAALGNISKAYPNVAKDAIPLASGFLDAESYRLRANAAGLVADLAAEYPTEVCPVVPTAIELLDDEDQQCRHNATTILARVAEYHPGEVEPATDQLMGELGADLESTRHQACLALGSLQAEAAREALEGVSEDDPSEDVREAARAALGELG